MALGTYISDGSSAPSYPALPSGFYTARVTHIEAREHSDYGEYIMVTWEIESPEAYLSQLIWERFYTQHPDAWKRKNAMGHYNDFLLQVGGIAKGGKDDPDLILDKVCELEVEAYTYKGREQNKIRSRASLTSAILHQGAGIALPHNPAASSVPFDDEIPFK